MAKTRGGAQVGTRRSRRNQGLKATPATTLKVKKGVTGAKKRNGGRKKKAPCEEVQDAPVISLSASSGEHNYEEESEDEVSKKEIPEKAASEKQECNHEAPEIEVSEKEAEDGLNRGHNENEEEAVDMEQDGITNGNTDAVDKEQDGVGNGKISI